MNKLGTGSHLHISLLCLLLMRALGGLFTYLFIFLFALLDASSVIAVNPRGRIISSLSWRPHPRSLSTPPTSTAGGRDSSPGFFPFCPSACLRQIGRNNRLPSHSTQLIPPTFRPSVRLSVHASMRCDEGGGCSGLEQLIGCDVLSSPSKLISWADDRPQLKVPSHPQIHAPVHSSSAACVTQ